MTTPIDMTQIDWKTRPFKERCDAFIAAYLSLRVPAPTNNGWVSASDAGETFEVAGTYVENPPAREPLTTETRIKHP